MGRKNTYKVKDFAEAIPNSGGIIDTIAKRVGCSWETAKRHITASNTLSGLLEEEEQRRKDLAESIIVSNMIIAAKLQKNGQLVDTGDAKWYLSRKAKDRGYIERQEVTGADGNELEILVKYDDSNPNAS